MVSPDATTPIDDYVVRAEYFLSSAAQMISQLHRKCELLQIRSDTVDQLCALGKSFQAGSIMGVDAGYNPLSLVRGIETLLGDLKERRAPQPQPPPAHMAEGAR